MLNEAQAFQPLKHQDHAMQLKNLQSDLLTHKEVVNKNAANVDKKTVTKLRERVVAVASNADMIPPFVTTEFGVHVFSAEERTELIKQMQTIDTSDPAFFAKAEDIVQAALAHVKIKDQEEQRDLTELEKKKGEAGKNITPESRELLDKKADDINASDPYELFGDSLVDSLSKIPHYQEAGTFLHQIREVSKELRGIVSSLPADVCPDEAQIAQIHTLTRQLLKSSRPIPKRGQLKAADVFKKELTDRLSVLSGELVRIPRARQAKWPQFREILDAVNDSALSPQKALEVVYKAETKDFRGETTKEEGIPEIELIQGSIDQIQEIFTLSYIQQVIDAQGLNPQQREYLMYAAYKTAVLQGRCSSTFAVEAALDSEILTHELGEVIKNLSFDLEEGAGVEATKAQQKRLSKLIVGVMAASIISQVPLDTYPMIASKLVELAQGGATWVASDTRVPAPKIDNKTLEELAKPKTETPTPIPTPVPTIPEKSEISAKPEALPDRKYEGKQAKREDMSWQRNADSGRQAQSPEGVISPEAFLNASTEIAWEISGTSTNAGYLMDTLSPYYNPENNTFSGPAYSDEIMDWHDVPTQSEGAEIKLSSKRKKVGKVIPIPARFKMHIKSAEVLLMEGSDVVRQIPVKASTSPQGELSLSTQQEIFANEKQEIRISVGLNPGLDRKLNLKNYISSDLDAKFPDRTIFPKNLLELIDDLNNEDGMTDVDKLKFLQTWFLDNFMYSFDPSYLQYYTSGQPSHEQYFRRLFGTGSVDQDSLYTDDPRFAKKGYCESVNIAFALAGRELNLRNGQIVMASGFIRGQRLTLQESEITNDIRHAYAVYVDNNGNETILDATPIQMDQFTQDVMKKLPPKPKEEQAKAEVTVVVEEITDFNDGRAKFPEVVRRAETGSSWEPSSIQARIEQAMVTEQPVDSWQYIPPAKRLTDLTLAGKHEDVLSENMFITYNGPSVGWRTNFSNHGNLKGDSFHISNYSMARPNLRPDVKLEDLAGEVVGKIRLNQVNAFMLPSLGEVSPATISVAKISINENGKTTREPIPISRVNRGLELMQNWMVVLDGEPQDFKDDIVEVRFKTMRSLDRERVLTIQGDAKYIADRFRPFLKKEWLGGDFQHLLDKLNQVNTLEELADDSYFYEFYPRLKGYINTMKGYPEEHELIDLTKTSILIGFMNKNYSLTWNPAWANFYKSTLTGAGMHKSDEYWRRVSQVKRVDPETATTLLIGAARLIKSAQGDFPVPIVAEQVLRDFAKNGPTAFFQTGFESYPDMQSLFTESERNFEPVLLRAINNSPEYNFYKIANFASKLQMPLDPTSGDLAAETIQAIIAANTEHMDQGMEAFVQQHSLSPTQRFLRSLQDFQQLRVLDWIHNQPWQADTALATLAGTFLAWRLKRRVDWWKGFREDDYKRFLDEASIDLGVTQKNPIYGSLASFYEDVVKPSTQGARVPIASIFTRAQKMGRFLKKAEADSLVARLQKGFGEDSEFFSWVTEKLEIGDRREQLLEIAAGKSESSQEFGRIDRQLVRKFLHDVYKKEYTRRMLYGRAETVFDSAISVLESIPGGLDFGAHAPSFYVFDSGINTKIRDLPIDDPETFRSIIRSQLENYIVSQVINYQSIFDSEGLQHLHDFGLPQDADKASQEVVDIVTESLLPYYGLVVTERRELAKRKEEERSKG